VCAQVQARIQRPQQPAHGDHQLQDSLPETYRELRRLLRTSQTVLGEENYGGKRHNNRQRTAHSRIQFRQALQGTAGSERVLRDYFQELPQPDKQGGVDSTKNAGLHGGLLRVLCQQPAKLMRSLSDDNQQLLYCDNRLLSRKCK